MSGKLPLISLGAVVLGVLVGNTVFATNPEVGNPRPVQQGVGDLVNNSSWNQVSYLVHEWWLGNQFGAVRIENVESSSSSRAIMFVGQLGGDELIVGNLAPTIPLNWAPDDLINRLYSYRVTGDGHLVYCREDGMVRRVFCSFNVFAENRPDSNSVVHMVGVDLGPLGVGLVESGLLDRLLADDAALYANREGLPQ